MRFETVGKYTLECSAIRLVGGSGWGARLAIYAPSSNPMHRTPIFPIQRVSVMAAFGTAEAAEEEAFNVGLRKLRDL